MSQEFRVVAIIAAFNEGDIISFVIQHLVENGVESYLIDNHSTDDTVEQASKWLGHGLMHIEVFPELLPGDGASSGAFNWTATLRRKEELAGVIQADWFIHHDADEIREGPFPGLGLNEAIRWVDSLGYNSIDFRVFNFPPVDDGFQPGDDPRTYFAFCEDAAEIDKVQIKTWKANVGPVSLQPSGGHDARFQGRRIFPIQFLLRHYPIRSQKHGVRKVFSERKTRFLEDERSKGWHRQYDGVNDESYCFVRNPVTLRPFVLDKVRLELLAPEKVLHVMQDHLIRTDAELIYYQSRNQELSRHAASLEKERDELKPHAANLEKERDEFRQHARNLEKERDELKPHAANLEKERDELRQHAANLEKLRQELEERKCVLEKEISTIHNSFVWRSTTSLRQLFGMRKKSTNRLI